jgi:PPOX class probable F420-dependent enzyme
VAGRAPRHDDVVGAAMPGALIGAIASAGGRYRRAVSARHQLAMSDDDVSEFLRSQMRAHVGTINDDGTPHIVPLAYVVLDGRVTFWTDPRSRKIANLRRDPRLTCLVEAGTHFAELRAVQLGGRAELGEDEETSRRVGRALFERASGSLDDDLRAAVEALVGERIAVSVHPDRVVTWDHRKLPGVRPGEIGT